MRDPENGNLVVQGPVVVRFTITPHPSNAERLVGFARFPDPFLL